MHSSSWLISAWHAAVAKTRVLIEIVESYLLSCQGAKTLIPFSTKNIKFTCGGFSFLRQKNTGLNQQMRP